MYDLYLFDFDGLLVNTEELQFKAYQKACGEMQLSLQWDFAEFCSHAHTRAHGMRAALSALFPQMEWDQLYRLKADRYFESLRQGKVELMPGVLPFLTQLMERGANLCVVTHSPKAVTDLIKESHRVLQQIPHWVAREDYAEPKPSPQSYLTAMERHLKPGGKAIGFEDSPRGLEALIRSGAKPIWVTKIAYPQTHHALKYPDFWSVPHQL